MRLLDSYIMDKMLTLTPFSITSVIIFHMREIALSTLANKVFSFPLFLTRLFKSFNIDFLGEYREVTIAVEVINGPTLR